MVNHSPIALMAEQDFSKPLWSPMFPFSWSTNERIVFYLFCFLFSLISEPIVITLCWFEIFAMNYIYKLIQAQRTDSKKMDAVVQTQRLREFSQVSLQLNKMLFCMHMLLLHTQETVVFIGLKLA